MYKDIYVNLYDKNLYDFGFDFCMYLLDFHMLFEKTRLFRNIMILNVHYVFCVLFIIL